MNNKTLEKLKTTGESAREDLLDIYNRMTEEKQQAFDLGEIYAKICFVTDGLGGVKNDD